MGKLNFMGVPFTKLQIDCYEDRAAVAAHPVSGLVTSNCGSHTLLDLQAYAHVYTYFLSQYIEL